MRENDDINGIKIDDREIKLSAFADDADFLIANVKSLKLIFDICSRFQSYSSLKLNLEKSEACKSKKTIHLSVVNGWTKIIKQFVLWGFLIAMIRTLSRN